MPLLHTEAMTLRRRRTNEADALVTLFTRSQGKIVTSTKSVLKTQSRYAGVTQPFNHIHTILYAKVEEQEIWTITQITLLESFDHLRNDTERMTYASCLAEWTDFLTSDFEPNQRIWHLLLNAFRRWNEKDPRLEDLYYYQWNLLLSAGLQPDITLCRQCRNKESLQWYYQTHEGGLKCASCTSAGLMLHNGSIQALRRMSASDSPPPLHLTEDQLREINHLLQQHLEFHAGMRSRASLFLNLWNFSSKPSLETS